MLEQIPGTREGEGEVEYETTGRAPMLEIRVKRDVLAKYNLHAGDVNQTIAAALGGQTVGTMMEGNRRFDIVVRLAEERPRKFGFDSQLPVRVGDAGLLPLGEVADIDRVKTVSPILRDSGQRRAALMVNLRGRDVDSWVREADAKVREHVQLPEGYRLEFGGQFENLREAKARLAIVVPAALAFIFVLIFMAFGSVRQALLVYSGVPFAITGGVVALWLRGHAVQYFGGRRVYRVERRRRAQRRGDDQLLQSASRRRTRCSFSAVIEGSMTRLRPVLMTAAVAAFGFIPMALSTSAGAEVQRPLATVVIGGIVSSTFLTLILVPVLYEWAERKAGCQLRELLLSLKSIVKA